MRAKAAAGEVPDPTSEGLAADGTPLFPTLAEQGVQPNQLRVMELASNFVPGKVLRGNNTRLQRFGGNKAYVVEVLPEEEELPQQSCLLYVQRRHPNIKAQAKAFEAVPDGSTPPKMVAPKLLDFALSTTGGCRGGGGGGGGLGARALAHVRAPPARAQGPICRRESGTTRPPGRPCASCSRTRSERTPTN